MVSNPLPPDSGLLDSSNPSPRRKGRPPKAREPSVLTAEGLRAVLQEQMGLVVNHVDEQVGGLEARLVSLEQRPPDTQAIVDRVAAVLGPELLKQINEKLERMSAASASAAANGHRSEDNAAVVASGQRSTLSARADDLLAVIGAATDVVLGKLYPLYKDHKEFARLDRQEARADKMMDTNPFSLAETMRAANSPLLPMYTAAFAPLPQVVADARVRETTDALLVGMRARAEATRILREETTRQRETLLPGSPSSSGSPTSASPSSPIRPNEGVNMASENGPRRRTLKEVMG